MMKDPVSWMRIFLPAALAATVILLYVPLARYPFVQDDWPLLHQFAFRGTFAELLDIFSPAGKVFYRPIGTVYCWLVYELFGLNPSGFHILSLLLLAASSYTVVLSARAITDDGTVAWGSGFLFASASTVHLDPLMWLVGAFDLGGGFFGLLCILAFLRKRWSLSAFWYLAALGFKESMAALLPLLAVWTFLPGREAAGEQPGFREAMGRMKWHAAAFTAFAAAKISGISLFSFPDTDTYAARLMGIHLLSNLEATGVWALQAVTPLKSVQFSENGGLAALLCALILLVLLYFAGIRYAARREQTTERPAHDVLFVILWFLVMIFPALTLKTHFYRYYLTAALPAAAIGTMVAVKYALRSAGKNGRLFLWVCMVIAAVNIIDGAASTWRRVSLGIQDGAHSSIGEGDNHLIRKATFVRETWKPLLAALPSIPPRSVMVFEGTNTRYFGERYGLQVWYGDSTLVVSDTAAAGTLSPGMPPQFHVRLTEAGIEVLPPSTRGE